MQPASLLPPLTASTPSANPYGSDNWANAFHNSVNPLAQFDNAMTGTTPQISQAQAAQSPISANDITQNLIANLGTPRYGMINPKVIQEAIAPYLASYEQAGMEARKKALADELMNAKDTSARRSSAWSGAAQDLIPWDAVKQADSEYQYENPHKQPYVQNTGKTTRYGSFDPFSGGYTQAGEYTNTMTPKEEADNALALKELVEKIRQFNVNDTYRNSELAEKAREFDAESGYKERLREDLNRPKYGTIQTIDGKLYQFDQFGNNRPLMIGGEHADAPANFSKAEWTDADTKFIENQNNAITDLQSQRQRLQDLQDAENDPHKKLQYNEKFNEIDSAIAQHRDLINAYILSKSTPQSTTSTKNTSSSGNLAAMMVGNANAGRITGRFGDKRKDGHIHKGIDIPAPEGEPIRVMQDMGDNLKVVAVDTNPNNKTNYGNYVVLEGTRGGKKVRYTIAHMKTGSVKVKAGDTVKPGDVIGGVGSTGRSTGNHLHLEVMVDGQRVDPESFLSKYPLQQQPALQTQTNTQNNQTSGKTTQHNDPVEWQNDNGQTMTRSQFNQNLARVNQGADRYHMHREYPNSLEANGWHRVQDNNTQPMTQNGAAVWLSKNGTHGITQPQYDALVKSIQDNGSITDERTGDTISSQKELDEWLLKEGWTRPNSKPVESVNHDTNQDVQLELNKLNDNPKGYPQGYSDKYGIFPAGFLGMR